MGWGRWRNVFGEIPRSKDWPKIVAEFEKYVPKECALGCGSKRCNLHHSQAAFHQDPSREKDPTQLRWLCEGIGTHNHHIIIGHAGNFQSLWQDLDTRIEFFQHRPLWNGTAWVPTDAHVLKYKLTEDDLMAWNKAFSTAWSYPVDSGIAKPIKDSQY